MSHRKPKKESFGTREVERLAGLAKLSLSQAEAQKLGSDLSSILEYFATLDKVDLSGARELPSAGGDGLRDDVVRPSTPEEVLEGVPQRKDRFVRAPRVF